MLGSISLPSSCKTIASGVFSGCTSLSSVTLNFQGDNSGRIVSVASDSFRNVPVQCVVHVPYSFKNLYLEDAIWSGLTIDDGPYELKGIQIRRFLNLAVGGEQNIELRLLPEPVYGEIVPIEWNITAVSREEEKTQAYKAVSKDFDGDADDGLKPVEIDQNGVVTGLMGGAAIITATSGDISMTCDVNVADYEMNLANTSESVNVGDSERLYMAYTWTSSDENVATVDNTGLVVGVSRGEATITVSANDGSNVSTDYNVKVVNVYTGVDEIEADEEGVFNVYDLQGRFLFTSEDRASLKTLLPGIYIVNTTKVLIR